MATERVLITVKTYPTLSRKHGETVCTAGVREDGSWLRIYPVPFRRLDEKEQYKKFDWITCNLIKSRSDPRPDTRHAANLRELQPDGHIGTDANWRERRKLLLQTSTVHTRLQPLIDSAKANTLSLAVFKPASVRNFTWEEEDERDWDPKKVAAMRDKTNQTELFSEETWRETFKLIPKLPYSFSYEFDDADGRKSSMQILDWEIGQLYWNCRKRESDESKALAKVRNKYFDVFTRTDLHFFLGTTQQFHFVAPNPWVIIGVFPIPYEPQAELFK
jgi:hypothetical protein